MDDATSSFRDGSFPEGLGPSTGPNQRLWQSLLDAVVFVDLIADLIDEIDIPLDPIELERLATKVESHETLVDGDARRIARALRHLAWIETSRTRR